MKQRRLALLIGLSMLAGYQNTSAQYSSVACVDAGGDRTLCHSNCFDLNVKLTDIRATDDYTIDSSIDFNNHYPFYIPGSGSVPAVNDVFSGAIRLPFSFCFYGKAYNTVSIGSNGIISFDDQSIGKRCEPKLKREIPSRAYAYAAIMPAYEALDLEKGGSIYYSSEGEAPNRRFIVNYNNIPLRSCSDDKATFQVVLYETTNAIEIYTKDKPSCVYYHDGNAIAGIQDQHKTGIALPGKNKERWGYSGMNAAYRFLPAAEAPAQYVQLSDMNGTVISQAKSTFAENGQLSASFGNVCIEGQRATYIVSTTYTNCGIASTVADTINISKDPGCEEKKLPEPVPAIKNEVTAINTDMPEARQIREVNIGRVTLKNPSTCLGINGSLVLHGLEANTLYTIAYTKNSVQQQPMQISSNAAGAILISKLSAGIYTDIKISHEGIHTSEAGPYVLRDPELPATPEPGNNGPLNPGDKLVLSVANPDRVSYTWLGPGLTAVNDRPVILNAQPYHAGVYTVVATRNGCNSKPATTTVAINGKGGIPNRHVPIRLDHNNKVRPMPSHVKVVPSLASVKQKPKPPPGRLRPPVPRPFRLTASSNSPVHTGATLRLHATALPGATYSWNGPNGFSTNTQNPALNNVSTNAAGIYTVTASSPAGMLRTEHVIVRVQDINNKGTKTAVAEPQIINGMSASATDPYVKYGHDGTIALSGLLPSTTYKVHFDKNGVPQPMRYCTTDAQGVLLIMWLTAGRYDNIYVSSLKGGRSNKVSTVLNNPTHTRVYTLPVQSKTPTSTFNKISEDRRMVRKPIPDIKPAIRPAPAAPVMTRPVVKDDLQPKEAEQPAEVKEEYQGIILSSDNAFMNETVTVDFRDHIRKRNKIKWDFGDAEVVSGSGTGPYILHWNSTGVKTIYLTLPYNIPNYGYRLQKQIYIRPEPRHELPAKETITPQRKPIAERYAEEKAEAAAVPRRKSIAERYAEENNNEVAKMPNRKSIAERYAEEENSKAAATPVRKSVAERYAREEVIVPQGQPVKKAATIQPPVIKQDIVVSRSNVCLNDTASISLLGDVPDDAELNWDFANGDIVSGSGAGPYLVRWDEKGLKTISLNITGKNSKMALSRSINVQPAPEVHFGTAENACPGEKVRVEIDMETKGLQQYNWDFDGADIIRGDGAGPYIVKWEQPGKKVVSLTVKGNSGCSSLPHRDIVTVHDDCCNVAVPSAFTPNGDGKNDVFHVASVGPHIIIRFVILNRYGRELFSTNNENEGWDGTLNGAPQEIGTYYYRIRYRCGETLHEKDGELMLLR